MGAFKILALGGDGVGPEVLAAGLRVADAAATRGGLSISVDEDLLHGAAWDAYGVFCREETVEAALAADAVLVGAVGGPKWDGLRMPGGPEMQDGLMRLRHALDAYAGLRPARHWPALADRTPYAAGRADGADLLVLREMCGGIMFAPPRGREERDGAPYGFDTCGYGAAEIRRIAVAGFELARARHGRVVSADKANVMESHKLWRETVADVATDYPDVKLSHLFADNCAYQMAMDPTRFDVIVGCNLIGDLLSDLAAIVAGGLGMLPSACLAGPPSAGARGLYEPVHGSAPDIAGTGRANPIGMILSVALMFEHGARRPDIAAAIERAVAGALDKGARTPDIGGAHDTEGLTDAILAELAEATA